MSDLIVLTSNAFKLQFGTDFFVAPNDEAFEPLLKHPDCPVTELQWAGEFDLAGQGYWAGGTGSVHSVETQILLLKK